MGKHKENQITEMLRETKRRRRTIPLLICLAMLANIAAGGVFQAPASAETGKGARV